MKAKATVGQPPEPSSMARGMYHLFLGNVTYTILAAVAAIVVGRFLGPAGYGLYAIALITPSYMQTIIQLGIPSASTRFPARYRSQGDEKKAV